MNARTGPANLTADSDGDDPYAAVRQLNDRLAAEADRYSRWADELAADGLPAGAELARRRADHLQLIVDECQRIGETRRR